MNSLFKQLKLIHSISINITHVGCGETAGKAGGRQRESKGYNQMASRYSRPVSVANRRGMRLIVVVVLIMVIALAVRCRSLINKNETYAQQIDLLEQQITEENGRTENIEEFRDYTKTNPYIEKVAREKLGLVYPDEIIFQPED